MAKSKQTSPKAAKAASKTLRSKSTGKKSKTAAGSAPTQSKSRKEKTSKKATTDSVFAVGIAALGQGHAVQLEEDIFRSALAARAGLFALTQIEMSYDVLIRNYSALTLLQLRAATQNKLGQLQSRAAFMSWLQEFNQFVGNLLSSARGYLDQTCRVLENVFGKESAIYISFQEERSKQYDAVIGYRLLEAIRNHHQHYSLGVSGISFPTNRVVPELGSPIAFSAEPYFSKSKLSSDDGLAKKLRDDLPDLPDKISVLSHVHDYVEALSAIHQHLRDGADTFVSVWTECLAVARSIYSEKYPAKGLTPNTPIALFEFPDERLRSPLNSWVIAEELFEYRGQMMSRNRQLTNLKNLFVTSRPPNEE